MNNREINEELNAILILKGNLQNISPFVIGKGPGEMYDTEIVKDSIGRPYIPATSFVGAVRHHLEENFVKNNVWEYFWGSKDNEEIGIQSHFIVDDLLMSGKFEKGLIGVRDGIKINEMGVAEPEMKYDYELVNKKCDFKLFAEVKIRHGVDSSKILEIIKTIINELREGNIYIGAMGTKGFGRFMLKDYKVYLFRFPIEGENYLLWLANEPIEKESENLQEIDGLKSMDRKDFTIEAYFTIKNSLIIGEKTAGSEEVDKVNISFNDEPVISGTSIKGAIRARAEKILNTLGIKGDELLKKTFGDVSEETKEKFKSRVIVDEVVVKNILKEIQSRIKIDRFTGGVIEGALFQSEPLWHSGERIKIRMSIKDFECWEAGLLLLVLKDLWSGDLAIGGEKSIGRGTLEGLGADISWGKNRVRIKTNDGKLVIEDEDADKLEFFVGILLNKVKKEVENE